MAKKTTRKGVHKKASAQRYEQNFDKLPVGSPIEHPDAVHQQRVDQLPTELQSIIVDLQNNRDDPSQLFPAIVERIESVRATVLRLVQGAHTAKPEAADQPPSPLVGHSTPTRGGLAVGSERPSARAARGAQLRSGNPPENNAQGTPPHEPPPQTPAAKQEPGAHA